MLDEIEQGKRWFEEALKRIASEENIRIQGFSWKRIEEKPPVQSWLLEINVYNECLGEQKLNLKLEDEDLEDCLTDHRKDQKELEADLRDLIKSLWQKKIGF